MPCVLYAWGLNRHADVRRNASLHGSDGELGAALPSADHQEASQSQSGERVEPQKRRRASEHGLHPVPAHSPLPRRLLVLQPLDFRLVVADGVDLGAEHDSGEGEEEESLQTQENKEHDSYWRGEVTTLVPLDLDTGEEVETTEAEGVQRDGSDVHSEQHKVSLVVFSNAVVHPGTMMIHFPDASLADAAVMSSLWFDAAAFRALVNDFPWFQL